MAKIRHIAYRVEDAEAMAKFLMEAFDLSIAQRRGEGVIDLTDGTINVSLLPIGAAFKHQSGDGYNVILQALPIPNGDGQCKIVLRPPKGDDDNRPQDNVQPLKSGSRRR